MFKPLKDITVLDLTQVLAGPFGSYQLSFLGAKIIKIENPDQGDWARKGGDDKELSDNFMGTSFLVQNSNKRSMRLDLKNNTGKSIFKRLAIKADVIIENMTPGKFAKLGFSFDNLKKLNPKIILCSISAYGQNGDLGVRPAYDHIIQAASGIMSTTGTNISGPLKVGAPYIDYATGLNAAFAITAAISNLQKDETAQWLDVSMYDTSLMLMSSLVSSSINSDVILKPKGNEAWSGSPSSGCFEASCGNLLAIAANTESQFNMLCETLFDKKENYTEKWMDIDYRKKHQSTLRNKIGLVIKTNTAEYWESKLNDNFVPASKVKAFKEVVSENHFKQRKNWIQSYLKKYEKSYMVPSLSFKVNNSKIDKITPPPELGQDTSEILKEFNFTKFEIKEFFNKKVAF